MRNKNLKEEKYESYIQRCKKVGRIGPKETQLDLKNSHGELIFAAKDGLDVEAISKFTSIRANAAVFSGRYYFEVLLLTNGLMQIGWCT